MSARNTTTYIRCIGFLVGCLLAVALLLSGHVPSGQAAAGASLEINTGPATELGVAPAGEVLQARHLKPGARRAYGSVKIANFTTRTLEVKLRAAGKGRDLDRLLQLRIDAGRQRLFRGSLGELRRWTATGLRLGPTAKRRVEIRAWIAASARDGYQGRSAEVDLEWKPRS